MLSPQEEKELEQLYRSFLEADEASAQQVAVSGSAEELRETLSSKLVSLENSVMQQLISSTTTDAVLNVLAKLFGLSTHVQNVSQWISHYNSQVSFSTAGFSCKRTFPSQFESSQVIDLKEVLDEIKDKNEYFNVQIRSDKALLAELDGLYVLFSLLTNTKHH